MIKLYNWKTIGDVVMTDMIDVLGVNLNCFTAKEAMLRAMQFMENGPVGTIEILSMNTLMKCRECVEWKELVREFDLVLPGEAEILKAAGVDDWSRLKETENRTFLKLFLKYLQKNQKKVFLLAQTENDLRRIGEAISRHSRGIRLSGSGILQEEDGREESVVNEINGTETDCILSVLASPYQEQFISRNKALLNAKIWLGCDVVLAGHYDGHIAVGSLRHFFRKVLFSWRAGKKQ